MARGGPAATRLRERPMAEYEFECRECKKVFAVFMRVVERASAKICCPGCGSTDLEPLMQAFVARTGKKS
jgi:putative FmdB family regulatory protein